MLIVIDVVAPILFIAVIVAVPANWGDVTVFPTHIAPISLVGILLIVVPENVHPVYVVLWIPWKSTELGVNPALVVLISQKLPWILK